MPRAVSAMCLAALVTFTTACSTDPEVAKREYVKSGDRYLEQGKLSEAIVQYRNAVQQDPQFGEARFKLARAYESNGNLQGAFREYIRAADLMPDSVEAQVKASSALVAARQFEDAKTRATSALERHPESAELHVVLGRALAGLQDFPAAIEAMEEAAELEPIREAYTGLGAVQLAGGRRDEAEKAFRKAIEITPDAASHLALANFMMATGRLKEAEDALREALRLEPESRLANRALALLLISTRRAADAEPLLKTLAMTDAQPGTPAKIALADYYIAMGRTAEARETLEPLTKDPVAASRAQTRLARIQSMMGDNAAALRTVDEVLERESGNVPALLTKARLLLGEAKPEEALAVAEAAVEALPTSARAHFILGQAHAALRRRDKAAEAYRETLRLNPRAVAAQVQLSRLSLAEGELTEALRAAQEAERAAPGNVAVELNLAQNLIANGRTARAEQILSDLVKRFPGAPDVWTSVGALELARRNLGPARRAFDRSLELSPLNLAAINGLTMVDFAEKNGPAAKARLEALLQENPESSALRLLTARTYLALDEVGQAEQALKRVIQQDPSNLDAYGLLTALYLRQNRLGEARAEFDQVAQSNPDALGAMTLAAMTCAIEGKRDEARSRYERILQRNPRASVAANNLAYMYATDGGNLDVALQLAQTAKAALPDLPQVNDTLGWVYYKKGLAPLAVPALEDSVAAAPKNPVYRYHLGLAYRDVGRLSAAREAFREALALNPDFDGAPEARRALEGL